MISGINIEQRVSHVSLPFGAAEKHGGFSLFEILIVVAVIAILAAIAMPAYQDYSVRTRLSEYLNSSALVKTGVWEYYEQNQAWPESLEDIGGFAGPVISDPDGKRYFGMLGPGGVYTITVLASENNPEFSVRYKPRVSSDGLEWDCVSNGPVRFQPSQCRNGAHP